jgi:hypothetical protein
VFFRVAIWTSAVLLAAGLIASQLLLGGWWYPALAAPGLLLVGAAAIASAVGGCRDVGQGAPGAWCTASFLALAGYMFWRQASGPDPYAGRESLWLLGGAAAVYFAAAWHVRRGGPVWVVAGALLAIMAAQSLLVVAQFAAAHPFHPWPDLARWFGLPRGEPSLPNLGYVSGTFASRGTLSAVLQTSAFISLGLLLWGCMPLPARLLLLWVTAAAFLALLLSLSRAAYAGTIGGFVVFALASFFIVLRGFTANRGRWSACLLLALIMVLGLSLAVGFESIVVRLRLDALGADAFREEIWFNMIPPMLRLDEWRGTGAGTFDMLASRYRSPGIEGRPFHAHNDWLQLLVEYGRIGFLLGVVFFLVHFLAGWRNLARVARAQAMAAATPQSTSLGLLVGSLAALAAQGLHSVFDHRLQVLSPVLLAALCCGWLAGQRVPSDVSCAPSRPAWLGFVGVVLPLVSGFFLIWAVGTSLRAEHHALRAENFLVAGDLPECWQECAAGLRHDPSNARLLVLAAECSGLLGNAAAEGEKADWYGISAAYWIEAVERRPGFAYALREAAVALDWAGRSEESLPFHLRAIARDPRYAAGYEYLGLHFWKLGMQQEAVRLWRLAQRLPGSRVAHEYLRRSEANAP